MRATILPYAIILTKAQREVVSIKPPPFTGISLILLSYSKYSRNMMSNILVNVLHDLSSALVAQPRFSFPFRSIVC